MIGKTLVVAGFAAAFVLKAQRGMRVLPYIASAKKDEVRTQFYRLLDN